ncbi:hypothetical protein ACTPEF_24090, partial [Clostridioides difficile]
DSASFPGKLNNIDNINIENNTKLLNGAIGIAITLLDQEVTFYRFFTKRLESHLVKPTIYRNGENRAIIITANTNLPLIFAKVIFT